MMFDRRAPPTYAEQLRILLWPRTSWERSLRYVTLRLLRIRATPHQLALGCAIGVFASITPFVGMQMALAGVVAMLLQASFTAAMLGTLLGNPVVWAILWPATYSIGGSLLGVSDGFDPIALKEHFGALWESVRQFSPDMIRAAFDILWPIVKPMLVGSVPVGLALGGTIYLITRRAAKLHQSRRYRSVGYDSGYPLGALLASYDPAYS